MSRYDSKTALFSGIIDYAGTFAPASLSLQDALKTNVEFRKTAKHPWLWAKVALNLSDIKNLNPQMLFQSEFNGNPLMITVLGSPFEGSGITDLLKHVEWDLRELEHCKKRAYHSSARQVFVSYELKLPEALDIKESIPLLLNRIFELSHLEPYFELPWGASYEKDLHSLTQSLSEWKEDNDESDYTPGIKIRTGGKYVPSTIEVAKVILATTQHRLRFKATQGLHHAVTSTNGLGFVNLFASLNLAQAYGELEFGLTEVISCLEDNTGKNFQFYENLFKYKKFELSCDDIEKARRVHAATFGSCSLDEPDRFLTEEL